MSRSRELADFFSGSDASISTTGDVTADEFIGDGAQLTGIDRYPTQTGNGGRYLSTNGSVVLWAELPSINSDGGSAATAYSNQDIVLNGGAA